MFPWLTSTRLAVLALTISGACSSSDRDKGQVGDPASGGHGKDPVGDASGMASGGTSEAGIGSHEDAGAIEAPPEGLAFPKGFVFGTAIAGFQADMGCPTLSPSVCTDTKSDWHAFTTSPETVNDNNAHLSGQDPAKVGPGFWELYGEDIARADDELHNQGLRFSIEWSRIFPEPTDDLQGFDALRAAASPAAVAHYHDVLKNLRDRGMRPF